jgi:hypothetical protein
MANPRLAEKSGTRMVMTPVFWKTELTIKRVSNGHTFTTGHREQVLGQDALSNLLLRSYENDIKVWIWRLG